MTYRGYEIQAFVDTTEVWSIDEDGRPADWVDDTEYMGDPIYFVWLNGELHESADLEEVKRAIDASPGGGRVTTGAEC